MQTKFYSISGYFRPQVVLAILIALSGCGPPPPDPPGTVHVQTTPTGAKIMLDGIQIGTTPMTVRDLEVGEHFIVLQKEDHVRLNEQVTVRSGQTLDLNFTLEHHTGQISVRTDPRDAQVSLNLDGRTIDLGETPIENAELDTGTYDFEIVHPNYHPVEGQFAIHHRGIYNEEHRLKAYSAKLHVFSRPTDAEIWVNEEKWTEKTPTTLTLSAGEYNIGIYKLGYNISEEVIHLSPNESYSHNALLKEGYMPQGMVLVPAGEFIFGDDNKSPDEKPMKKVHLDAFYIDKFEVTNAQFEQVFPNHTFPEGHDSRPVRGITWKQANGYAKALNKRLPTEMEWEKAGREGAREKNSPGDLYISEITPT